MMKRTEGDNHKNDEGNGDKKHRSSVDAWICGGFEPDGDADQDLRVVVDEFDDSIPELFRDKDGNRILN